MTKTLLLCLLQAAFFFATPALAQSGTTDGTYDFSGLGRQNSGGQGFKKQKDKFKVSNVFAQDGMSIYADNNNSGASQTVVIKAEGGVVNKTFTVKNIELRNYSSSEPLDLFTITFFDYSGDLIASHSLATAQSITLMPMLLTTFNFTVPFPASGYPGVSEIRIDYHYANASVAPDELTFDNITVAEVKAMALLPLTLIQFTVKKEDDGVRVQWKTTNEQDVSQLVLEHSIDGMQFGSIASFTGTQRPGSGSFYSHLHQTPAAGRNYYRLREKTTSGDDKVYAVKTIDFAKGKLSIVGTNPVQGPLTIKGLIAGEYNISVTDISGRMIYQTRLANNTGGTSSFLLPSTINRGTYLVTVKGGNGQASARVVKE